MEISMATATKEKKKKNKKPKKPVQLLPEWERYRMVSIRQAAELLGISEDTFRRQYPHLIVKV
jgi:hypothetical protein